MPSANPNRFPEYRLPARLVARIAWCALVGGRRSLRQDSIEALRGLVPPLHAEGLEHIPPASPLLVVTNHYHRPGFGAWWIALAISSVLPVESHWMMAAAWTYPDVLRSHTLEPLTRWAFQRLGRVYDFTMMPPMPPRPHEAQARSQAVRQVVAYARQTPNPVIGLAPEGQDFPGGVLGWPPPGVGRFIAQLARQAPNILPVGAFEADGCFYLRFGPCESLDVADGSGKENIDFQVSRWVMRRIACQLPAAWRGEFG